MCGGHGVCELVADLQTRKRLVKYIREFNPDVIFTHRTNDYHADHRNTALLVQDASYLLIVPNFCKDVPAMEKMPIIMFYYDKFQTPPFQPQVVVSIDSVIDKKFEMFNCHQSQIYEWLPYTYGELDQVPQDKAQRLEWYKSPKVPRDRVLSLEEIIKGKCKRHNEYYEAFFAAKYRDLLINRYGEQGKKIIFAEVFGLSEYGSTLTSDNEKDYFPF